MNIIRAIHIPLTIMLISLSLSIFSGLFLIISLIFLLDVMGRYQDYVKLTRIYESNPTVTKSLWNMFSYTRCSREVMIAVDPEAKNFYSLLGYKWYHFLPDNTFSKSSPFLDLKTVANLSKSRYKNE